ncbi:MAG TPA: FAD-dependent oxidoreductase [Acidimicrobiales bacterium]|nr:FAD-dependent oxidoreductase [Acidimicrobiales bacterium]
MRVDCDVVVVGAGTMGSSTAWWLARRGVDVVLLEQFEQGHVRGSSHGGSRIFRLAYPDVEYVALAQMALPLWRELEDDAGVPLLDTTGGIDHGDPSMIDAVRAALGARDATFESLSPDAAHERWPAMDFDRAVLAQPDAGRCRADDTVRALQDRAAAHGAAVHFSTGAAVVAERGEGVIARCPYADLEVLARVAVVTAGAWIDRVAPSHIGLPPLHVTQEQIVHFAPRDETDGGEWPSFIHHRSEVGEGVVYGLRTPGEGIKVGGHHEGPVVDPDQRSFDLDPGRVEESVRYAERWLPGVEPVPMFGVTCLYTTTPTEDFVVDRRGSFVIGSACSGHGFKFTPAIGLLLADLAMDASAVPRIARFGLPR